MEGGRKFLTTKFNQTTHLNSTDIQDFFSKIYLFISRKLSEITHLILNSTNICDFFNNVFLFVIQKLNEFLPVETRSETLHHWARIFLFLILPVTLLLLCFYRCCCRCIINLGSCLRRCFCCCCGNDYLEPHGFDPTMRAPGRYGQYMPRSSFERDPRSYFKHLRAKKALHY